MSSSFFHSNAFKLLVFVVGAIVLGAILSPLLYWGGKHVVAEGWLKDGWLHSIHESMERAKFSRYFNRAQLAGALIMLWPTLRWMSRGKKEKTDGNRFGLEKNPRWPAHLTIGFFLAGIPLLLLGYAYVSQGWYVTKDKTDPLFSILISSLITGMAVGFLEEFVFRGALHAVMAKVLKPWPLLISIAVFFAIVHFLQPPHNLQMPEVTMGTGFWILGKIFGQFGNPYFLAAEFAVLFAIGWVLGWVRMKTASLWLGIGLHAGWVFGVKVLSSLTSRNFEPAEMMPWLGGSLRVGAVSCFIVCLTGLVLWLWLRKTEPRNAFEKTL